MTKKYIEQEVKLEIENLERLIAKLNELGAENIGVDFQRTIRFDTQNDDLEKKGTFLRVRSGHGNKVTMKRKLKKTNNDVFEREEIETTVEDVEKLRQIIRNLGFDKERIMEKYRANWKYKEAELSIDELPFGLYLEIESTPEIIGEVISDLGMRDSKRITTTYWDILEENNKKNSREDKNIVFSAKHESVLI